MKTLKKKHLNTYDLVFFTLFGSGKTSTIVCQFYLRRAGEPTYNFHGPMSLSN